jgi:hypothetical protein
MPSDYTYAALNEDRYTAGVKIANSGYMRVTVSPVEAKVEYIRTYLPRDEGSDRINGAVAHSYVVKPAVG